jgi:serine/threonine protein kinase
MAVETVRAFRDALEASNLLEAEQLAAANDVAGQTQDLRALAQTLVRREWLSRWQAEQLLAGRRKFFVGKYKLVSLIGRGGMSSVFLARHMMMNRPVALKLISRQLANDPPALERFLSEVRAIASLDHPNIVHAYNVDCDAGRYFLVMEYVEGWDLKRIVDAQGPLAFDKAADYLRQAAEGLAHAHAKGIVHHDIKPANLLVNAKGVVKILDLGIAELVDPRGRDSADDEKNGELVGTVDYMAPEQAMGDSGADHRVDLYSLGCTLFFLLTGRAPFAEGTLHERIVKHQSVDPPDLSTLRADTPRELGDLCRRLMSKEAADRPASAQEVVAHLSQLRLRLHAVPKATPLTDAEMEELLTHESPPPSIASEPTAWNARRLWQRLSPGQRKSIVISAAAGCLLAACVSVAAVFYFHGRSAAAAKSDAAKTQQPASNVAPANGDEPDEFWGDMTEPHAPGKTAPGKAAPGKTDLGKTGPGKSEPVKSDPAKTAAAQAAPAKAEPGKTELAKNDATKLPSATSDPAKTNPGKTEPGKTGPAKTEPAKTEPAKPSADPWKDFPKAVELPPVALPEGVAAATPTSLLRVPVSPETPWTLALLGGEEALPGARRVVMTAEQAGGGAVRYTVWDEKGTAGAEPTEIAGFSREQDALLFRWSATADNAANALRNCLLSVTAAGQTRAVALRKPLSAEPVVFLLTHPVQTHPISVQSTSVEWIPDPTQLRLEVLKFEGRDDLTLVPAEPLSANSTKKHAAIVAARKGAAGRQVPAVEFRLNFSVKQRPKIVQVDVKLMSHTAQQFALFENPAFRLQADGRVKAINRELPAAKPEVKHILEQEYEGRQAQIWFDDFYKAVHRKAKMHYRVYVPVGEQQIEILRTSPP